MHDDERLELGNDLGVGADRELRLGSLLDQREVELLESRDLFPREALVAELRQRLAAPQSKRLVEQRGALHRLGRARRVDQAPDPRDVELLGLEPHDIAGRPRLDHAAAEGLPQLRDEVLERSHRRGRRAVGPQSLDQAVLGDNPARFEQEHRERRPLLGAAERDRFACFAGFERTQEGEFDQRAKVVPPW